MKRLDKYLVDEGFFETRTRALLAIKNNQVFSDGNIINKASSVKYGEITVSDDILSYVSKGALKLLGAIDKFKIDFTNKTVLDVGSSTGGFSEVALERAASKIYAVDVGTDQMHQKLRNNEKITLMEQTNILNVSPSDLAKIDIVVMDVSFVSILKLIDHLISFNAEEYVLLIKPQFETGGVGLIKGIVKSAELRNEVVGKIKNEMIKRGLEVKGIMKSPIKGGSGNTEYIIYLVGGKNVREIND